MRLMHWLLTASAGFLALGTVFASASPENGSFEEDHLESASFSSSVSSSSEPELLEGHLWSSSSLFDEPLCAEGEYMGREKCHRCSGCAPDFYARRGCQADADVICDSCFAKHPLRNLDYWLKCLAAVRVNGGKSPFEAMEEASQSAESRYGYKALSASERTAFRETVMRVPVTLKKPASAWSWKVEFILESMLYLAVVLVAFAGFRLATRSKPYYRTVTITAPVLDEADKTNIHTAAEYLREKLRGRRYIDLEEFV